MSHLNDKLKVALCQMIVTKDKDTNLQKACEMVDEAVNIGAELVILPECFNCPYGTTYFTEYAESIDDSKTRETMEKIASKNKIWLIAGSIPEKREKLYYNTSMIFSPDGNLDSTYSKMHLFKINTEKVKFDESEVLTPGNESCVVHLDKNNNDYWKIGMGICFDIRYPLFAQEYCERGTHMLVYPGAFNMVTGPVHWELMARARAIDTQQYVCVCSPARDSEADYVAYGHSSIIDPFGTVIATCDEKEQIVYGEISLSKIKEVRESLPILAGRNECDHIISPKKIKKELN
jgi:predicted amidohydrolase